jgi:phospholipase/carboxylesterase
MSGFLPRVEGWPLQLDDQDGLRAAIAHGSLDPVISVSFGREARDALTAAGADVLWHESPVPHTIDPAVLPLLRDLIADAVPAG